MKIKELDRKPRDIPLADDEYEYMVAQGLCRACNHYCVLHGEHHGSWYCWVPDCDCEFAGGGDEDLEEYWVLKLVPGALNIIDGESHEQERAYTDLLCSPPETTWADDRMRSFTPEYEDHSSRVDALSAAWISQRKKTIHRLFLELQAKAGPGF